MATRPPCLSVRKSSSMISRMKSPAGTSFFVISCLPYRACSEGPFPSRMIRSSFFYHNQWGLARDEDPFFSRLPREYDTMVAGQSGAVQHPCQRGQGGRARQAHCHDLHPGGHTDRYRHYLYFCCIKPVSNPPVGNVVHFQVIPLTFIIACRRRWVVTGENFF